MSIGYADIPALAAWADSVMQRPSDLDIGGGMDPYLRRWWVIPRNEFRNTYLHLILRSDEDRALHDHAWENESLILRGQYREHTPEGTFIRSAGDVISRDATAIHRLELIDDAPVVSLFSTGPKVRDWGFHCPQGFVPWQDFTSGANGELIGRGCGE